jgi:nitroimidazol reductase NimA-like FMN-containing flavoprotein (pyridoxamine 5'-phosphate oxidase superfamily)
MSKAGELSRDECLALLAGAWTARVAFTERALPAIVPVTYSLAGGHLMLRIPDEGLAARLHGQVVAFQVDDADASREAGWSVQVTGTAVVLSGPDDPARQAAVSLVPGTITGRRITVLGPARQGPLTLLKMPVQGQPEVSAPDIGSGAR